LVSFIISAASLVQMTFSVCSVAACVLQCYRFISLQLWLCLLCSPGGRAVVLEALRQYHLTDRVSSTTTLEENDERTVSALERCKMKGRRVSVGSYHQT